MSQIARGGKWLAACGAGLCVWAATASADTSPPFTPDAKLAWDYTTGVLWHVGGGATPLSYTLAPQILTLSVKSGLVRPFAGGTLALRPRFILLVEPIVRGPESYYVGGAAAGELEWRSASGRFAAFWAAGGGGGWMDSKGYEVVGGAGQDFNFNWLVHAGVRVRTHDAWAWSLGLYFQHLSNRGMDPVNPGINALGPTLGLSRRF